MIICHVKHCHKGTQIVYVQLLNRFLDKNFNKYRLETTEKTSMRCSHCAFVYPDDLSLKKHETKCEDQKRAFCSEVEELCWDVADADCDPEIHEPYKQAFDEFIEELDEY